MSMGNAIWFRKLPNPNTFAAIRSSYVVFWYGELGQEKLTALFFFLDEQIIHST